MAMRPQHYLLSLLFFCSWQVNADNESRKAYFILAQQLRAACYTPVVMYSNAVAKNKTSQVDVIKGVMLASKTEIAALKIIPDLPVCEDDVLCKQAKIARDAAIASQAGTVSYLGTLENQDAAPDGSAENKKALMDTVIDGHQKLVQGLFHSHKLDYLNRMPKVPIDIDGYTFDMLMMNSYAVLNDLLALLKTEAQATPEEVNKKIGEYQKVISDNSKATMDAVHGLRGLLVLMAMDKNYTVKNTELDEEIKAFVLESQTFLDAHNQRMQDILAQAQQAFAVSEREQILSESIKLVAYLAILEQLNDRWLAKYRKYAYQAILLGAKNARSPAQDATP
ncbi:MAG: hypothetical protein H7A09_04100 [Oceanospirillaceae bacterium]|nr:hypothetical protein [Oceanospirillaceae bacterium]MCP5335231.1 hypothetical protein [Oceanospirillaceae bacterium]